MIYMEIIMIISKGERMNKYYYKNIWEWNASWKDYCLKCDMNLSVTCYEEFLNDLDENFILECEKGVSTNICFENNNLYLFLVLFQNNMSSKIFDYYKVWKRVENDIPLIQKGIEKKYSLMEENVYVGVALFDFNNIRNILKFMLDTQRKSFIYCSINERLIDEQESIKICNKIFNGSNCFIDEQIFLKSVCGDMLKDEAIIQIFFDGESIGMNIFKKW